MALLLMVGILGMAYLKMLSIPQSRITWLSNVKKIRKNMTEDEVGALLGKPYEPRSTFIPFGFGHWEKTYEEAGQLAPWVRDRIYVYVSFTQEAGDCWRVERVSVRNERRSWKERRPRWLPW